MTTNRDVVTGYLAGLVGTSLLEEGWESLTPSWSSVGSMTAGPLEQCGSQMARGCGATEEPAGPVRRETGKQHEEAVTWWGNWHQSPDLGTNPPC